MTLDQATFDVAVVGESRGGLRGWLHDGLRRVMQRRGYRFHDQATPNVRRSCDERNERVPFLPCAEVEEHIPHTLRRCIDVDRSVEDARQYHWCRKHPPETQQPSWPNDPARPGRRSQIIGQVASRPA